MAERMTDERLKYLDGFIRRLNAGLLSGDIEANHWSHCGVELLDHIAVLERERDGLREIVECVANGYYQISSDETLEARARRALRSGEKAP